MSRKKQKVMLQHSWVTPPPRQTPTANPPHAIYGLPIIIFSGGESRLSGELYEVSRSVLEKIDKLEGHPGAYCRETIIVGQSVEAQAHIWQGDLQGAKRITSGDWRN